MLSKCILCNSNNLHDLYVIKGYHIAKCKDCELVFVKENVDKNIIHDLYQKTYFYNTAWYLLDKEKYLGYDDYVGDRDNIRNKFGSIIKVIKHYIDTGPLLDIGCGLGFFLELAQEKGFNPVKGIDISTYAVEYCRENLKLDVQQGEIKDFVFPSQNFNIITMFDVIEHFKNPKSTLLEINRILKDSGFLVIVTPDIDAIVPRLIKDRWEEIQRVPEHLIFFSKKTITSILKQTGFDVIYTKYVSKKLSLRSFISHVFVNFGINKKFDLRRIPNLPINIRVNPMYKLLVIARKNNL